MMVGKLQIVAASAVVAGVQFQCVVYISGAQPGDIVQIRLRQTAGVSPLYDATTSAVIDPAGDGTAFFNVTLSGPCVARLIADDVASQVPLAQDDAHMVVT
jgi:hypothetical protein